MVKTELRSLRVRGASLVSILVFGCLAILISSCKEQLPIIEKAPDFELINQDNKTVRLSDFSDRVVVISFMYIKCPMANMCPLTTKQFKMLQESLGDEFGEKVMLLLITFDPEADVPGALKKYGELYGADFSNWNFLTGSQEAIDKICDDYGIIVREREPGDVIPHSMMTFLIDQKGNTRKEYLGNNWEPESVKEHIARLID